ncbi:unnamed protein product [Caenorhabditis bovis]|uniref:THAP-type domain-containing protein n=1 Tax=Caenorhabditis bovis TaxID=2654633 RepID=A0A8S1ETS3_9PELO|nr:unnamed protein product [Caenorhabditis bovis]
MSDVRLHNTRMRGNSAKRKTPLPSAQQSPKKIKTEVSLEHDESPDDARTPIKKVRISVFTKNRFVQESLSNSQASTEQDSENSDIDIVLPVDRESSTTNDEFEELEPEMVFSSFPCQIVPETLIRLTKTPVEGEHLEVRRNKNGRLRIIVVGHYRKFSCYSTMTHRPCIVCNRQMQAGEMHLNFPVDLDRRRIWANLLGFKYKDILRSKVGPISYSIAGGPICTEHFAEECFRNHNFNKAAIEAFGVPVAISPDVKTTPSKKRVPWVCTICDYCTCSVVELQKHLLDHAEEMANGIKNFEIPSLGFMCPFCRKCTYGYRTISGFKRHLLSPPIQHCHLRRIYEFAKMNCRASELEPIESWANWTRRNVYVAYHGCEPPVDEVILTPSPQKSPTKNFQAKEKNDDVARRKKAVRTLSFVGKEGGTAINDCNLLQRAVQMQYNKMSKEMKTEEAKKNSARGTMSAMTSPVKKRVSATGDNASSCPNSPAKSFASEEPKKKIDDYAFAKMIEKRAKAVKRLISAKMLPQAVKPRKAVVSLPKLSATLEMASQQEAAKSATDVKEEDEDEEDKSDTPILKKPKAEAEDDERPLKSVLARSFAAGHRPPMVRFKTSMPPIDPELLKSPQKTITQQFYADLRASQEAIPLIPQEAPKRLAAGSSKLSIFNRRPIILSSRGSLTRKNLSMSDLANMEQSPTPQDDGATIVQDEQPCSSASVSTEKRPMTIVEALEISSKTETNTNIGVKDIPLNGFYQELDEVMRVKKLTRLRQELRMSKHCMRQLEAASARARLFGTPETGDSGNYEVVQTKEGPQLVEKLDSEWKTPK